MALRELLLPWDAQPQEAANPADEALSATTFAAHAWAESGSGGRIVGPDGIAFASDGSTRHAWTQASLPLDPPLWFAIWYDRTVSQSAGTFLGGIGANAATGAVLGIRVPSANVAGVNVFFRRVNGGSFIEVGSDGVTATSLNTPVCVVGVIPSASSGDAYVCVGGVRYSTVVTAGTLSGPGAASAFLAVGGLKRDSFSLPSTIRTYGVAFGRAITERFALELSADPLLMFAPRRIPVPVSAAASTYTLGTPTYVPGSITSTGLTARVTVTAA